MFDGEILRWGRREQAKTVFEELAQKNQDPILDGWMLQRFALAEGSPLVIIIIRFRWSEKNSNHQLSMNHWLLLDDFKVFSLFSLSFQKDPRSRMVILDDSIKLYYHIIHMYICICILFKGFENINHGLSFRNSHPQPSAMPRAFAKGAAKGVEEEALQVAAEAARNFWVSGGPWLGMAH